MSRILQSCCSSPIRRNSVLAELRVRRLAVIQEEICCRAFSKWLMLEWKSDGWKERKSCVSSAYRWWFKERDETRVLSGVVYMTKSGGPRTEPWGTPHALHYRKSVLLLRASFSVKHPSRFCSCKRDAMHKRGLCRQEMSIYMSVCHVRVFCRNKYTYLQQFFSPSDSHTILFFAHQTLWQYSDGNSSNCGVECSGGGGRHEIVILDQYLASSRAWTLRPPGVINTVPPDCGKLVPQSAAEFVDDGRRQRSVYDKKPQRYPRRKQYI